MCKQVWILFALLIMITTGGEADITDAVFSLNGKAYRVDELSPKIQQAYHEIELKAREAKENVLLEGMVDTYLTELARSTGRSADVIRHEVLEQTQVTDDEVRGFYDRFKDKIGIPLADVAGQIRKRLELQKMQASSQVLITELLAKGQLKQLLPELTAPVFTMDLEAYPRKGKAEAPIQLVEFADYRCGYCKEAKQAVDQVLKEYPDEVQFIYIDLPVLDQEPHGVSTQVAQGAYCAGRQGKYWAYHDLGYANPVSLSSSSPRQIAQSLGLDIKQFDQCMASKEAQNHLANSSLLAENLGVSGTPMFLLNGQHQSFYNLEQDMKKEIARRLARSNHSKP